MDFHDADVSAEDQWLELQLAKAPTLTDARRRRLAFLLSPTTRSKAA